MVAARIDEDMVLLKSRLALGCACLILAALGGCAREPANPAQARTEDLFRKARERCPVTVADTEDVQRCMRAQGWSYRLPWQ